jgi:hypothetical protein
MNRSIARIVVCMVLCVVAAGCGLIPGTEPQAPAQTLNGTLKSVRPVSGGEPTGWILQMGAGGMGGYAMPLDISKVLADAKAAEGKEVTVTGRPDSAGGPMKVESIGIVGK